MNLSGLEQIHQPDSKNLITKYTRIYLTFIIFMFELKITNLSQAIILVQQWATHTVSLLDPDLDTELFNIPKATKTSLVKRCYFHDVIPNYERISRINNLTPATREQIEEILAFTQSLELKDKLLVHCHAGISRSTAVAIGILCQHGLNPSEATQKILDIRPQAFPNRHILQLFDDIFALNGQLVITSMEEVKKFDAKLFYKGLKF